MNLELGKREGNKVSFSFEIGTKELQKATNEVYLENRKYFNVPGFRQGKAPRQIIEMNYGKDVFFEDAVNEILPAMYAEAVEELELEPVAQPEINIEEVKKGEPLLVEVEVEVKPEVKLGDYKGLELEDVEFEVTDEMIDTQIEQVREQNARLVELEDENIEEGHLVNIDFKGSIDGEEFEGGAAEGHDLEIGSNTFIPGFEEQLIGHSKGEEIEVKVDFPEDYHAEDLAGEEAVFEVVINNIREKELPELDDDFAIDISEFDTLEEYKDDLRAKLEEQSELEAENAKRNKIVELAVANAEIDIPRGMIESEIDDEIGQIDYRLRSQGLELGAYLEMTGGDMLGLREEVEPMAIQRIKSNLVLEAIAEAEEIEVSEEDLNNELARLAEQYQAEDVEEFTEQMKSQGQLELIESGISNSKVIDLLLENVK